MKTDISEGYIRTTHICPKSDVYAPSRNLNIRNSFAHYPRIPKKKDTITKIMNGEVPDFIPALLSGSGRSLAPGLESLGNPTTVLNMTVVLVGELDAWEGAGIKVTPVDVAVLEEVDEGEVGDDAGAVVV